MPYVRDNRVNKIKDNLNGSKNLRSGNKISGLEYKQSNESQKDVTRSYKMIRKSRTVNSRNNRLSARNRKSIDYMEIDFRDDSSNDGNNKDQLNCKFPVDHPIEKQKDRKTKVCRSRIWHENGENNDIIDAEKLRKHESTIPIKDSKSSKDECHKILRTSVKYIDKESHINLRRSTRSFSKYEGENNVNNSNKKAAKHNTVSCENSRSDSLNNVIDANCSQLDSISLHSDKLHTRQLKGHKVLRQRSHRKLKKFNSMDDDHLSFCLEENTSKVTIPYESDNIVCNEKLKNCEQVSYVEASESSSAEDSESSDDPWKTESHVDKHLNDNAGINLRRNTRSVYEHESEKSLNNDNKRDTRYKYEDRSFEMSEQNFDSNCSQNNSVGSRKLHGKQLKKRKVAHQQNRRKLKKSNSMDDDHLSFCLEGNTSKVTIPYESDNIVCNEKLRKREQVSYVEASESSSAEDSEDSDNPWKGESYADKHLNDNAGINLRRNTRSMNKHEREKSLNNDNKRDTRYKCEDRSFEMSEQIFDSDCSQNNSVGSHKLRGKQLKKRKVVHQQNRRKLKKFKSMDNDHLSFSFERNSSKTSNKKLRKRSQLSYVEDSGNLNDDDEDYEKSTDQDSESSNDKDSESSNDEDSESSNDEDFESSSDLDYESSEEEDYKSSEDEDYEISNDEDSSSSDDEWERPYYVKYLNDKPNVNLRRSTRSYSESDKRKRAKEHRKVFRKKKSKVE